jgi:hypothetical protein
MAKKKVVVPTLNTLDEVKAWLSKQTRPVSEAVIQKALEQVR